MNKPYNIQNTNICNGIFHISFFKALLIYEGETTLGERESGRNDPGRMGIGTKRLTGRTGFGAKRPGFVLGYCQLKVENRQSHYCYLAK
jgi:hypothetical protein